LTINLDFLPQSAFVFLLIFARAGSMVMALPGIGDRGVPVNIRLVFALALTYVFFPLMQARFPALPGTYAGMLALYAHELIIGIALGMFVRIVMAGVQIAGTIVGFQSGLSFATSFDPNFGGQSNIMGSFMAMLAAVLIFAGDLHHLLLAGIYDSYSLFPPDMRLPAGDFSAMAFVLVAGAFRIGVQMAAPFIIFGLIFYLGIGILARLIPQIQIFFIAMPANIFVSLILFMLLLSSMMMAYIAYFQSAIAPFMSAS
jgi:flagellar biosynthetic protein FliR